MKVERWGDGLVIPVPDDVVKELGLKPGDDVSLVVEGKTLRRAETPAARAAIIQSIQAMARPLPRGWKFDRAAIYEDEGRG